MANVRGAQDAASSCHHVAACATGGHLPACRCVQSGALLLTFSFAMALPCLQSASSWRPRLAPRHPCRTLDSLLVRARRRRRLQRQLPSCLPAGSAGSKPIQRSQRQCCFCFPAAAACTTVLLRADVRCFDMLATASSPATAAWCACFPLCSSGPSPERLHCKFFVLPCVLS